MRSTLKKSPMALPKQLGQIRRTTNSKEDAPARDPGALRLSSLATDGVDCAVPSAGEQLLKPLKPQHRRRARAEEGTTPGASFKGSQGKAAAGGLDLTVEDLGQTAA